MEYKDVQIELLERYPCQSKAELDKREGDWIRSMECINKKIAGRTPAERYQDNKDAIAVQRKEARKTDASIIEKEKVRHQKYYEANKQHCNEVNKKYREANKDRMREYDRDYYQRNKEKKAAYKREYYQRKKLEKAHSPLEQQAAYIVHV
jgi:hypothetical protein